MRDVPQGLQEEEIGHSEDHRGELLVFAKRIEPGKVGVVDGKVRPEVDGKRERCNEADEGGDCFRALRGSWGDHQERFASEHQLPQGPEVEEEAAEASE